MKTRGTLTPEQPTDWVAWTNRVVFLAVGTTVVIEMGVAARVWSDERGAAGPGSLLRFVAHHGSTGPWLVGVAVIHALMLSVLLTRAGWAQLAARVGLLLWVLASVLGTMCWGGS